MKWLSRILLPFFLLLLPVMVCAQDRPATEVFSLRIGQGQVRNTYLTPVLYSGTSFGAEMQRWRQQRNLNWLNWQQFDLSFTMGIDPGYHSEEWAGRLRYRYGVLHAWQHQWRGQWKYAVGPYMGIDAGFDYNLKMGSSNNPATARATVNLGTVGIVSYRFPQSSLHGMRLHLQAAGPLLGAALQPEYGSSYYEAFYLMTAANNVHFSSLHNQQDLDAALIADVPLSLVPWWRNSDAVLRLGGAYRIETMCINQVTTRYSNFEFVVGWVYQYLPFGRHKSKHLSSYVYEAF